MLPFLGQELRYNYGVTNSPWRKERNWRKVDGAMLYKPIVESGPVNESIFYEQNKNEESNNEEEPRRGSVADFAADTDHIHTLSVTPQLPVNIAAEAISTSDVTIQREQRPAERSGKRSPLVLLHGIKQVVPRTPKLFRTVANKLKSRVSSTTKKSKTRVERKI
jgi:hypothetical protein